MNAITQKQIRSFMKMRHPEMRYHAASGEWIEPGAGRGMTQADVESEAIAEIKDYKDGYGILPYWYDVK